MNGKVIRLNDYKFEYGKETVYINVFAGFKDKKSGNKYVIYSYDNKKLHYGTLFIRNDELVVMSSKNDVSDVITEFIDCLLNDKKSDRFEIILLDKVDKMQIIDDVIYKEKVDIEKIDLMTVPKVEEKVEETPKKEKKKISIVGISLAVLFIVIMAFFFLNPEVIYGKNKGYSCNKRYNHNKLPALVEDKVDIVFSGRGKVLSIDITSNYAFIDTDYYKEFRDKNYFYKYFKEGDTYKFDDVNYAYILFSKVDLENDYFMPSEEKELIKYYEDDGYSCKNVEMSE